MYMLKHEIEIENIKTNISFRFAKTIKMFDTKLIRFIQ